MKNDIIPETIPNWIDGRQQPAVTGDTLPETGPGQWQRAHPGRPISDPKTFNWPSTVPVDAQPGWAALSPVERGEHLHAIAQKMRAQAESVAAVVALETGMSYSAALGETDGAIAQGEFMAGEGRRLYGRTTTSGDSNKYAMTVRQPMGVAGLIVAANTPIANVAWKVFPALICGNAAVLKPPKTRRRPPGFQSPGP